MAAPKQPSSRHFICEEEFLCPHNRSVALLGSSLPLSPALSNASATTTRLKGTTSRT